MAQAKKFAEAFAQRLNKEVGSVIEEYEASGDSVETVAFGIFDKMLASTQGQNTIGAVIQLKKRSASVNPSQPGTSTDPSKPADSEEKPAASSERKLTVKYFDANPNSKNEATRVYTLPADTFEDLEGTAYQRTTTLAVRLRKFVMRQLQDGYQETENTFEKAAEKFLADADKKEAVVVELYRDTLDYSNRVVAYDIHNGEYVFDRLYKVDMRPEFDSWKGISDAFYNNTQTLKDNYLYVGFATSDIEPVLLYRAAYLERIARRDYMNVLNGHYAQLVVFVVPKTIRVTVEHVFPEGTRSPLREVVPVEYEKWASLQNSSQFMDLPSIFQTRIQKVNEMGFAYNHVAYFNGQNPITGLLLGYDWFNHPLGSEGDDGCIARVYYDKAVAGAKEVPTEKKVDAASAPQAQIKAPAAQAPVTAANTTTTTAPANTLPVTGASDSIFLFLSSAALMAVGILFFKKH